MIPDDSSIYYPMNYRLMIFHIFHFTSQIPRLGDHFQERPYMLTVTWRLRAGNDVGQRPMIQYRPGHIPSLSHPVEWIC